jgi:excisionase family DNA binding protein
MSGISPVCFVAFAIDDNALLTRSVTVCDRPNGVPMQNDLPPRPLPVFALTVGEAAQSIGIGRTRLYELITAGEIKSYTEGTRRMVSLAELRRYVGKRDEATANESARIEARLSNACVISAELAE